MKRFALGMLTALALAAAAEADVRQAAADGFLIEHRYAIAAAPDAVWRDLAAPGALVAGGSHLVGGRREPEPVGRGRRDVSANTGTAALSNTAAS